MALIPLLPKPQRQEWPPQTSEGLHGITPLDYQRNLCENYYNASAFGTPSPVAQALIFKQRLDQFMVDVRNDEPPRFAETFETWSLLIKGIYLGVLDLKKVDLAALGDLGEIVARELPEGVPFHFITFGDQVVGFTVPEIGVCSSVRLSEETEEELRSLVEKRSVEKAADYFAGWVRVTFDALDQGELLFYPLLYELARRWASAEVSSLPMEPERLFAEGPTLGLSTPSAGDVAVVAPKVPLYIGTPITCSSCGYEISKDTRALNVKTPQECRCPQCGAPHDTLKKYEPWIRWDEERGTYLIYAFERSPLIEPPLADYLELDEDGARMVTGRFTLKVFGLVLTEAALRCDRLTFFRDGNRLQRPDLPVCGQFFGLVQLAGATGENAVEMGGDYVARIDVAGWDDPITLRYTAEEIQVEEALILSWPNFRLPGWNAYYYLLQAMPELNAAGIRLRGLQSSSSPELLEETRGQVEHPFEAYEVVFTKVKDRERRLESHGGIFVSERPQLRRGESPVTLALDFGTTNSSIWYEIADGSPEVLRFKDFTEELVSNEVLSRQVLENSHWLPTYRIDDPDTATAFYRSQLESTDTLPDPGRIIERMNVSIPSEIIADRPVSPQVLAKPLVGYTICHAYGRRPSGEVLYNIKTLGVQGDPGGRFEYDQIVSRYLEQLLVMALASILNEHERAGFLRVRISFPRAFRADKVERYLQTVDSVLARVKALTGFETNSQQYIDESHAAAYSMEMAGGLALIMDMGGGTTDIGIFEQKKGEHHPLMVDSFEYGGNAFLNLLVDETDLFPKPTEPLKPRENRLLWLLREIRMRGFKELVQRHYHGSEGIRSTTLDLLLRFYAPVAYYAGKLFAALGQRDGRDFLGEKVTCYLVGNGWTLADSIPSPDGGEHGIGYKEIVRYLLKEQGFTQIKIAGEATFGPQDKKWPGPKAAVGYGMLKAPSIKLYDSIAKAAGVTGIQTVIGLEGLTFHDGGEREPHSPDWHAAVPFPLPSKSYRPDFSAVKVPKEWEFIDLALGNAEDALLEECARDIVGTEKARLERSPLTRFIEKVYRYQLPRARRT